MYSMESHASTLVRWQVVIGDVRFKGEDQNLYTPQLPNRWTWKHQKWHGHSLSICDPLCKIWWRSSPGGRSTAAPISCGFRVFFFFFSGFFDKPTAKTTEPIFMVDSSKDVILLKEVPLGGLVAVAQKMWAWHPENPQFFAPQCIFPFKKESITMRKPYQIEQKLQRNTISKVGSNFQNPASLRLPDAP